MNAKVLTAILWRNSSSRDTYSLPNVCDHYSCNHFVDSLFEIIGRCCRLLYSFFSLIYVKLARSLTIAYSLSQSMLLLSLCSFSEAWSLNLNTEEHTKCSMEVLSCPSISDDDSDPSGSNILYFESADTIYNYPGICWRLKALPASLTSTSMKAWAA